MAKDLKAGLMVTRRQSAIQEEKAALRQLSIFTERCLLPRIRSKWDHDSAAERRAVRYTDLHVNGIDINRLPLTDNSSGYRLCAFPNSWKKFSVS